MVWRVGWGRGLEDSRGWKETVVILRLLGAFSVWARRERIGMELDSFLAARVIY
jgi:hypothetical protein